MLVWLEGFQLGKEEAPTSLVIVQPLELVARLGTIGKQMSFFSLGGWFLGLFFFGSKPLKHKEMHTPSLKGTYRNPGCFVNECDIMRYLYPKFRTYRFISGSTFFLTSLPSTKSTNLVKLRYQISRCTQKFSVVLSQSQKKHGGLNGLWGGYLC